MWHKKRINWFFRTLKVFYMQCIWDDSVKGFTTLISLSIKEHELTVIIIKQYDTQVSSSAHISRFMSDNIVDAHGMN